MLLRLLPNCSLQCSTVHVTLLIRPLESAPSVANTAPVDAQENAESLDDPAIRVGAHWSLAYNLGDLQFVIVK